MTNNRYFTLLTNVLVDLLGSLTAILALHNIIVLK